MASREEIEAALEAAIAMMRQAFDDTPNESLRGPYNALRTHLSRLREEARFRDAAMEWNRLREELSAFREPCSHVEEYSDLSAAHGRAEKEMRASYRTLVSARALEEPRDG